MYPAACRPWGTVATAGGQPTNPGGPHPARPPPTTEATMANRLNRIFRRQVYGADRLTTTQAQAARRQWLAERLVRRDFPGKWKRERDERAAAEKATATAHLGRTVSETLRVRTALERTGAVKPSAAAAEKAAG